MRVDGFSNTSTRIWSAMSRGLSRAGTRLPAFFMAWAVSTIALSVAPSMASRSRKCLGAMADSQLRSKLRGAR